MTQSRTPEEVFAEMARHSDGSGQGTFDDVIAIIRAHRDAE